MLVVRGRQDTSAELVSVECGDFTVSVKDFVTVAVTLSVTVAGTGTDTSEVEGVSMCRLRKKHRRLHKAGFASS